MLCEKTPLPGLLLITPHRHSDARGHFSETWSKTQFAEVGVNDEFVQDNQSLSTLAGTVRGLHFQAPPHAQAKLVKCVRGALFDAAVDLRKGSPTFGQWYGAELSSSNGKQLYIPQGYAHGFVTREADTEVHYKCSAPYAPESECALRFDDPDLGIDWQLTADPILSERDRAARAFAGFSSPFTYESFA